MTTYDVKSIEGKVRAAKEGVALLRKIPDRIRRNYYLKALAEKLGLQESLLYELFESSPQDRNKTEEILRGKS